jgi:hypothetical protein
VRGRAEKWCGERRGLGTFYSWKRGGEGAAKAMEARSVVTAING